MPGGRGEEGGGESRPTWRGGSGGAERLPWKPGGKKPREAPGRGAGGDPKPSASGEGRGRKQKGAIGERRPGGGERGGKTRRDGGGWGLRQPRSRGPADGAERPPGVRPQSSLRRTPQSGRGAPPAPRPPSCLPALERLGLRGLLHLLAPGGRGSLLGGLLGFVLPGRRAARSLLVRFLLGLLALARGFLRPPGRGGRRLPGGSVRASARGPVPAALQLLPVELEGAVGAGALDLQQRVVLHQRLDGVLQVGAPVLLVEPRHLLGLVVDLGQRGAVALAQFADGLHHQLAVLARLVLLLVVLSLLRRR